MVRWYTSRMGDQQPPNAMQYSSLLNRGRSMRIYQGRPTTLVIRNAKLTMADIYFTYVGNPQSYLITLTNASGIRNYNVNHNMFVSIGYYRVTGITPNSTYEVNVIAQYVSGDIYSVNSPKTFSTSTALGTVQTFGFTNPTNEVYKITSLPMKTSFNIEFTPLNDEANYKVIVNNLSSGSEYSVTIPYDKTQLYYTRTIPTIPFDTSYNVSINSIYENGNETYTYLTNNTHRSIDEMHLSYLDISSIHNTYVDLSYSSVDVAGVIYKLYLNDLLTKSDTSYTGVFHVTDLSINTMYPNTYVSVTYPGSGNEYKNAITPLLSFTTLNEGDSIIYSVNVKNTEIGISYLNDIGYNKTLLLDICGTQTQLTNYSGTHIFTGLAIDTSYNISIKTKYTTTENEYTGCSQTIKTLNEGPIKIVKISNPNLDTTRIEYESSPGIANLYSFKYTVYHANNYISASYISFDKNYIDLSGPSFASNSSYTVSFESVYLITNNHYFNDTLFTTIDSSLDAYNAKSKITGTQSGNTVVLTLLDGSYYTSHDISYSSVNGTTFPTTIHTNDWTEYTIYNLNKDTSYNISVKSELGTTSYTHPLFTVKTLNEGVLDTSHIEVGNTFAKIAWPTNTDVSYISINNTMLYRDFSYVLTDLSIHTYYDFSYTTVYKTSNNPYVSNVVSFTTLNEDRPAYSIDTYFHNGNVSTIEIRNPNQTNVDETIINIVGIGAVSNQFNVDRFHTYSGNIVTTYHATPSTGKYSYYTKPYITDFSFVAIMYKPVYTVDRNNIHMDWFDISSTMNRNISYSISIDGGPSHNLSATDMSYNITNLSMNTIYGISFMRSGLPVEFQSIQTLNEGSAHGENSILQNNSRLNNVVFDISNINEADVYSNKFILMRDSYADISYSSRSTIFDIDISNDTSYNFIIYTTYTPKTSSLLNVMYATGAIYSTELYSFTVVKHYNPTILRNGTFNTTTQNSYLNGIAYNTIPTDWNGVSLLLSENTILSSYTKYLNVSDVSNNVILFNPRYEVTPRPSVSQLLPYLYKDYYQLTFYVANHKTDGVQFGYGVSSNSIGFKIVFSLSSNEVIFETSPIISTDTSWNKYKIKLYIPNSAKNVTFSIERTNFELNNLFISDISLTGLGEIFPTSPAHTTFTTQQVWDLPDSHAVNTWKGIMPQDLASAGNTYCLSSHMSIGFWLYIHDSPILSQINGIFIIGSTMSTGHPSVYITDEIVKIDNNGMNLIQSGANIKLANYYHITFDRTATCLYKNGTFDSSFSSISVLTEASPSDLIYLGTPYSTSNVGYIMNNITMYDFPLQASQISDLYEADKPDFSQMGNYSDLSGHYVIVDLSTNFIPSSGVDVSFELNNNIVCQKKIRMFDLSPGAADLSLNSYLSSVAFWGMNLAGNISFLDSTKNSVLKLTCNDTNMFPSLNESWTVPVRSDTLQHFAWTFDVNGKMRSYLNGYLYDLSVNQTSMTSLTDCSYIQINATGKMGDFHVFEKSLSQSEVLTTYYNYYNIHYTYDMSGFYRVMLHVPEFTNLLSGIPYLISDTPYSLHCDLSGSISNYIDISMSGTDLNHFNKNQHLKFTLSDNNIFTMIEGSGNPYIYVTLSGGSSSTDVLSSTDISENNTFYVTLKNAKNYVKYPFQISGANMDLSHIYLMTDVSNNDKVITSLKGNISNLQPISFKMKGQFTTMTVYTLIFAIGDLGLTRRVNVLDTTANMLSTTQNYFVQNESFVITLTFPTDSERLDFSYEIKEGSSGVKTSSNVFRRSDTSIQKIDISFEVITDVPSTKFTLKLVDNPSYVYVMLNDATQPILTITDPDEEFVNDGDNVTVELTTPMSWENGRRVPYKITETNNCKDISSCDDISYSAIDMTGFFIVQNTRAEIICTTKKLHYSRGIETITFALTDVSYNDISASIFIVDTYIAVSCRWVITDPNGYVVTQVNEGGSFIANLITSGFAIGTDISYSITGIDALELSGNDTRLTGTFITDTNMSRVFTIVNDFTVDGAKTMNFTTIFNDESIMDVTASILVNDTSQSIQYKTNSSTTTSKAGSPFTITLQITNYSLLTVTQQNTALFYTAGILKSNSLTELESDNESGKYITGKYKGGVVLSSGTLVNGIMSFYFSYSCIQGGGRKFMFVIPGTANSTTLVELL